MPARLRTPEPVHEGTSEAGASGGAGGGGAGGSVSPAPAGESEEGAAAGEVPEPGEEEHNPSVS